MAKYQFITECAQYIHSDAYSTHDNVQTQTAMMYEGHHSEQIQFTCMNY